MPHVSIYLDATRHYVSQPSDTGKSNFGVIPETGYGSFPNLLNPAYPHETHEPYLLGTGRSCMHYIVDGDPNFQGCRPASGEIALVPPGPQRSSPFL